MIELSLRPFAGGCKSSPVPFIEGWYVIPECRRAGVGIELMGAAEEWARKNGYAEMASSSTLENEISYKGHLKAGFEKFERIVLYCKKLI